MKLEFNDTTFLIIGGLALAGVGGFLLYKNFVCPNGQWNGDLKRMFNIPLNPKTKGDDINIPITEDNLKLLVENDVLTEHQAASVYADEVYRRDGLLKDYKQFSFAALEQGIPVPRVF